jgi:glycosyltransferase involved in cell wall biosynthesis
MRGFWADEKRDGGAWKENSFFFRQVYKYYKKKEAEFIENADCIIVLTHAAEKELKTWKSYAVKKPPLEIIPCCADMIKFSLTDNFQKKQSRIKLGLPDKNLVVSYLGSIGAWYMLDEMLLVFAAIKEKYPSAIFLFITHTDPALIRNRISVYNLSENDIRIFKSSPEEVPEFIKSSDISLSFIKPVYSKISSSPTKLGELLSMGIPVVCNAGVGDVEQIITESEAGYLMHSFSKDEISGLLNELPEIISKEPLQIRKRSEKWYNLDIGIEKYYGCYRNLLMDK